MELKDDTVSVSGFCTEILFAIMVASELYAEQNVPLVITSGSEHCTKHMDTSLHYAGRAVDLRSRELDDAEAMARAIKIRLGRDFDVVCEQTHIHVEHQPRRRA